MFRIVGLVRNLWPTLYLLLSDILQPLFDIKGNEKEYFKYFLFCTTSTHIGLVDNVLPYSLKYTIRPLKIPLTDPHPCNLGRI